MPAPSGNEEGRKPLQVLRSNAWVPCIGALLGIVASVALLWGYQTRFIFEPDRVLHAAPSDFSFPVADIALPVGPEGRAPAFLHGWWIPSPERDAKVILYLHGNYGNVSTSMREVAPLRELKYSIFLIDYRGYGESEGAFPSEQTVYEDAEGAWRYLVQQRGIRPAGIYIFGHSLGGAIAIELALHHPEAGGLIVESSFTSIADMATVRKPFALLPVSFFITQRFDSLHKVDQLKLPVLYVHGTADDIIPFAMAERLFGASGGTKRFMAIEGGGHDDLSVSGGARFRAAISAFVEGMKGSPWADILAIPRLD